MDHSEGGSSVEPNGRVDHCQVVSSSGNAALDEATCRLVEKRYRYQPSRDAQGRPIATPAGDEHRWSIDDSAAGEDGSDE